MAEPDTIAPVAPDPAENYAGPMPTSDLDVAAPAEPVKAERSFEDVFKPRPARKFEDVFKRHARVAGPSLEDVPFGQEPTPTAPMSPEEWADYMQEAPAGRVMSAFGAPFNHHGLSEAGAEIARKAGLANTLLPKLAETNQSYVDAIVRPIVTQARYLNEVALVGGLQVLDYGAIRPALGVMAAAAQGLHELEGTAVGEAFKAFGRTKWGGGSTVSALGQDVAAGIELFLIRGEIVPGGLPGPRAALPGAEVEAMRLQPRLPEKIARMRANDVIGTDEAVYFGLKDPTPEQLAARQAAAADLPPDAAAAAEAAPAPAREPVAVPTVHDVARNIDPGLMAERDALDAQRTNLTRWMGDLRETLTEAVEAKPPAELVALDAEIAAVDKKAANAGARRQADYAAQREALIERRADMVGDLVTAHPDMVRVREAWQKAEARRRDIAPDVSRVLREADELRGPMEERPGFKNEIHENVPVIGTPKEGAHVTEAGYTYRSLGDAELADIQATGSVRANPAGKSKGGRENVKHWSRGDGRVYYRPDQQVIRVKNDALKSDREVDIADIEVWNRESGGFEPLAAKGSRAPEELGGAEAPAVVARQPDTAVAGELPPSVAPEPVKIEPEAVKKPTDASPAPVSDRQHIVDDVRRQLLAVGRPAEEAEAAAAVIASRYEARAAWFDGKLGTAREFYEREPIDVRKAETRIRKAAEARAEEFAQMSKPEIQRHMKRIKERNDRARERALDSARRMKAFRDEMDAIHQKMVDGLRKIKEDSDLRWEKRKAENEAANAEFERLWRTDPEFRRQKMRETDEYFADMRRKAEARAKTSYQPKPGESSKPQALDDSGAWPIDEDGFVLADNDAPIKFGSQKAAGRWILDHGNKESAAQTFEVANHPSGDGFTVWERTREDAAEAAEAFHQAGAADTSTPEFKTFFGESKVVDEAGEPLVVYKGAYPYDWRGEAGGDPGPLITTFERPEDFPSFDSTDSRGLKIGGFFGDRETASRFGQAVNGAVYPSYLRIEKPYVVDAKGAYASTVQFGPEGAAFRDAMRSGKYDGAIIKNTKDEGTIYVTLKGEQSKSVHNDGSWDRGDKDSLSQKNRGGVSHVEPGKLAINEGRKIIRMMATSDASTFMHEASHVWLGDLMRDSAHPEAPAQLKADAAAVLKWLGVEDPKALGARGADGKITKAARKANETWARGWERYLMEGVAPSKELAAVFARFRKWLTDIYQTVGRLRSPINDDIRAVFDRLLAKEPERTTIAPERREPNLADVHETDADMTAPGDAGAVRDRVHGEIADHAAQHTPELTDALTLERRAEAGPGAAQRPGDAGGADAARPDGAPDGDVPRPGAVVPGGGKAGAEGFGPPRPRESLGPTKQSKLYAKVPKRPPSLADWIKARGGVKDDGGEISALGVKKPGLIKDTGESADDLASAAQENGFFPELGGERPTVNEFLRKLESDLKGDHQWSEFDDAAVAEYRAAVGRNAEIDRIAGELEIEAKGLTHEQFWDTVADRQSVEQSAKEADSLAAASEEALVEAERQAQAFLENQGDAWEPAPLEGGTVRTLEDLENEHRQAQAAREPIAGAADVEPAGTAGGDQAPVQAGGGQGGGGAGLAGRAGPEVGEGADPRGVAAEPGRYESSNPELVDKAGNIVIENLNAPEDINQVLRDTAVANDDFLAARRGVVTDQQALDFALEMGVEAGEINLQKLRALSLEDGIPLEARLIKGRLMLRESAKKVRDAQFKAAGGTEADLMAYAEVRARHMMIQETLSAATAEMGRGLRAFRILKDHTGDLEAKFLDELFQGATNRTMDELRAEARAGTALETTAQTSKLISDARKVDGPTWIDKAIEFRQSAMLWGPRTWRKNFVGNTVTLVNGIFEHAASAVVGEARGALTGADEHIYFGEIAPRLFATIQGVKNGWRVAKQILKDERFVDKNQSSTDLLGGQLRATPEQKLRHQHDTFGYALGRHEARERKHQGAIEGTKGEVARGSFRILGATDAVFRAIAYQQKLAELVYRTAHREGLSGEAFKNRVTDLSGTPPLEMMQEAARFADYQTFQGDLNGVAAWLQSGAVKYPILRIPFPFVKTPLNVLAYASERSVLLPFVKEARENLMGMHGAIARDEQLVRLAWGSVISTSAAVWAMDGNITGGGPKSAAEQAALRRTGWRPYSIKVGGYYVSYLPIEPISTLIGVAADAVEIGKVWGEKEAKHLAGLMFASVNKNFTNKSYMQGLAQTGDVLSDPDRYGEEYVQQLVTSFVPNILTQGAQAVDPYMRDARDLTDSLKSRIPGLSSSLMPRYDIWGQMVARDSSGSLVVDAVNPFTPSAVKEDPVDRALLQVQLYPAPVPRRIQGVELTPEQYDKFAQMAGRLAKLYLDDLVAEDGFASEPGGSRRKLMMDLIDAARATARDTIIVDSEGTANDIGEKALEAKAIKQAALDAR